MANYQTYKKINGSDAILNNSVGPGQVTGVSTGVAHQIWACSNNEQNHYDACSGGCCILWTVPALTTTVRFELTGGGGSGSPGTCCGNGVVGGSGSYAVKTLHSYKGDFTAGSTQYTICAGTSSRCSCCGFNGGNNCCGSRGCPSYVNGSGLSNFCAAGGAWGWHQCGGGCYSCTLHRQCNECIETCVTFCGADHGIKGIAGSRHNVQYCQTDNYGMSGSGVGPYAAGSHMGLDACTGGQQHGCCKGHSFFPGGAGFSPFTDGSCCWGGFGAAGLVVISYWQ